MLFVKPTFFMINVSSWKLYPVFLLFFCHTYHSLNIYLSLISRKFDIKDIVAVNVFVIIFQICIIIA